MNREQSKAECGDKNTAPLTLPISAVVPTRNRTEVLGKMLASLAIQGVHPDELIVVDASETSCTREMLKSLQVNFRVLWVKAEVRGAAAQRNLGVSLAKNPFIWFCDDDVIFDPDCLDHLWRGLESDHRLGGVNAMITNQRYRPPGLVSRQLFRVLHGHSETTYAGRVIGPAVNLLPEDRPDLPEIVPVEWLNTTCTLYRRSALPSPTFDSVFSGYSMMEDLALSLRVGKQWKLANARTARIFHDSQPSASKSDVRKMAEMELVNRHYVMTQVLARTGVASYAKLALLELFHLVTQVTTLSGLRDLPRFMLGKLGAIRRILCDASQRHLNGTL